MSRNSRHNNSEAASRQLLTQPDLPTRQYPCPELKLATAYVPPQPYGKQFKPDEALKKGTLWPDLYAPYPPPNPR